MVLFISHSHYFLEIFYFNIPLKILLYFIFQFVVKVPLINNSTSFFYNRFDRLKRQNLDLLSYKNLLIVLLSAGIGNLSHILWDSFTHKEGLFEGYLPYLLESVNLLNKDVYLFQLLQTWSSITGGIYIIYFIYKMPIKVVEVKSNFTQFWITAVSISFLIIYLRDCQNASQFIATSISSGIIGLIFSSLFFKKN